MYTYKCMYSIKSLYITTLIDGFCSLYRSLLLVAALIGLVTFPLGRWDPRDMNILDLEIVVKYLTNIFET